MEDLGKVNSVQLYKLWKNFTVGMLTVVALMAFSKLLPYYLSPVISLICAAFLYTYIYENRVRHEAGCMIVPTAMLYSLVVYSFVTIVINLNYAWGIKLVPQEMIFFNSPYISSLIMNPVCFLTFLVVMFRQKNMRMCVECRIHNGDAMERGVLGSIYKSESHYQLRNLTVIFGILSALIWAYYLVFYVNININSRDWYVFTWLTVIFFILDELYFMARYYNLYLDLKDNNEIITPEEIQDMTAKTYLRFYVICGNKVYVDTHAIDPKSPYKEVIDTPFFTKRTVNGIAIPEVKKIIRQMTGADGELRFFYGRKMSSLDKHSLLRYFYFLDPESNGCPALRTDGEWMDYDKIKYIYANNPGKLADLSVVDTSRLATIILTEKTFDENGYRKSKIKVYNPSFNLYDVKNSTLDFQDDKWIRISMFNSDTPFYTFKRKWRNIVNRKQESETNTMR